MDLAETAEGRRDAWALNADAPAELARLAARHGFTLVHYSTDYVFDGSVAEHDEDEPLSPLGVYGQSKAAGELAVGAAPRHYLLRTSWVVGDGPNFVRTMARLADEGATPSVVSDQVGRLTFTDELARATRHLLEHDAPYGTYHVTNGGPAMSWADVAREVFAVRGRDAGRRARDQHRGVLRRKGRGAAPGEQHPVDAPDRGDRLRARGCGRGTPRLRVQPAVVVVESDDVVLA